MNLTEAKDSLDRYINHGIAPGSFLRAVLENNLYNAINFGDADSLENLNSICLYIYNYLPGNSWGSKETVRAWVAKFYNKK